MNKKVKAVISIFLLMTSFVGIASDNVQLYNMTIHAKDKQGIFLYCNLNIKNINGVAGYLDSKGTICFIQNQEIYSVETNIEDSFFIFQNHEYANEKKIRGEITGTTIDGKRYTCDFSGVIDQLEETNIYGHNVSCNGVKGTGWTGELKKINDTTSFIDDNNNKLYYISINAESTQGNLLHCHFKMRKLNGVAGYLDSKGIICFIKNQRILTLETPIEDSFFIFQDHKYANEIKIRGEITGTSINGRRYTCNFSGVIDQLRERNLYGHEVSCDGVKGTSWTGVKTEDYYNKR